MDNVAAYAWWRPVKTFVLLKVGQNAEPCKRKCNRLSSSIWGMKLRQKQPFISSRFTACTCMANPPGGRRPFQRIYLATIGMIDRMREFYVSPQTRSGRAKSGWGAAMVQFLGESLLLTIALALVDIFLPLFNQFVHGDLHLDAATVMTCAPAVMALTLSAGLLAGSYPASSPPFAR